MIDHVMIVSKDKGKMKDFYQALLAVLGKELIHESERFSGFGEKGRVPFWLSSSEAGRETRQIHLAFSAGSRREVRAFHEAAMALGATCHGPPGLRQAHGPHYYAAYVLDPEGNNIECVCYAEGEG